MHDCFMIPLSGKIVLMMVMWQSYLKLKESLGLSSKASCKEMNFCHEKVLR